MPGKLVSFPCPSLKVIASLISGSTCRGTRKETGCHPQRGVSGGGALSGLQTGLAQLETALIQQGLLDPEDLESAD